MADKKIVITLKTSPIGCTQKIQDTILGLGLKKRHQTRELKDTSACARHDPQSRTHD